MKAVKGNKVYTIGESQQKFYVDNGFDILDEEGRITAYGRGKTVPFGEYMELKAECERVKKEKEEICTECEELRERLEACKGTAGREASGKKEPETHGGQKESRRREAAV